MSAIASQITSLTIVFSTVYSDPDQRKHHSSASLAFVRGIHRGPVNSAHKWPVTRKMSPFDDVIMDGSWWLSEWGILTSFMVIQQWTDPDNRWVFINLTVAGKAREEFVCVYIVVLWNVLRTIGHMTANCVTICIYVTLQNQQWTDPSPVTIVQGMFGGNSHRFPEF